MNDTPPAPRFDMDAKDRAGARAYLLERAHQALIDGFRFVAWDVEPLVDEGGTEWGARAFVRSPSGELHQTFYVYAPFRGLGHAGRFLAGTTTPIVTVPDCDIEDYLASRRVRYEVVARITASREYRAIEAHYGSDHARRSGVPFMHHIDEGLTVLRRIGATERAMRAYCLHPLFQADDDLRANYGRAGEVTDDPQVLLLALEYRNIANATLSHREIASSADISLSPLEEVQQMLVADKVQNWKDFILHHRATHARRAVLDRYFRLWLERLGVSQEAFAEHFVAIQATPAPLSLQEALERAPLSSPPATDASAR